MQPPDTPTLINTIYIYGGAKRGMPGSGLGHVVPGHGLEHIQYNSMTGSHTQTGNLNLGRLIPQED